jgi:uncharacterized membrane protein YeiB
LTSSIVRHRLAPAGTGRLPAVDALRGHVLLGIVLSAGGFFAILAGQVLLMSLAAPVLTVGTAAGGVLLYEGGPWPWLESAGRLALSNYLLQSVVFSTVFYAYGGGLFGRVAAATGVFLAVALFATQLIVSRWWQVRFGTGPVERGLRWMTYGGRF